MNTPERRPKPGLFTQFLAACAICLGLMTAAEFAGAYTAEQEVVQQENDNAQHNQAVARLRTDNKLPAAYTESGLLTGNEGEIIITADYHPIEPLHEKTRRHQRRGRDYGLLGGL